MASSVTTDASLKYMIVSDNFITEKPYSCAVPFSQDPSKTTNITESAFDVSVTDVRTVSSEPTLDVEGFEFIRHEFYNQPDGKIEGPDHPYLVEVAEMLKARLGASDVIVYDCNVRKLGNSGFFQAATSVHVGRNPLPCAIPKSS